MRSPQVILHVNVRLVHFATDGTLRKPEAAEVPQLKVTPGIAQVAESLATFQTLGRTIGHRRDPRFHREVHVIHII